MCVCKWTNVTVNVCDLQKLATTNKFEGLDDEGSD